MGKLYPVSQVKLYVEEKTFGSGPCKLLEFIQETGSIQKACEKMNLSYSKARKLICIAEKNLGYPLIKSQSGGNGGGGSVLTKKAIDLIWKYRSMEAQVQEQTEKIFALYFKEESE